MYLMKVFFTVTPGRASGSTYPGNITNFRNSLWSGWEQVLSSVIFTYCCQVVMPFLDLRCVFCIVVVFKFICIIFFKSYNTES